MVLSTRDRDDATVETPSGEITSLRPPRLVNAMGTRTVMLRPSWLRRA